MQKKEDKIKSNETYYGYQLIYIQVMLKLHTHTQLKVNP